MNTTVYTDTYATVMDKKNLLFFFYFPLLEFWRILTLVRVLTVLMLFENIQMRF